MCAQCHVTYVIPKDKEMKSVDVFFPWQGSKFGDISVENVIKILKSDPAYLEWKQTVTGFKVGFSRHPEFEVYSRNSVHWNANVACADCHMQYTRVGANKISNHNVGSPLMAGDGGLPAVPRRVRRLAEGAGDRHPGPHHFAPEPGRVLHRSGGQAL